LWEASRWGLLVALFALWALGPSLLVFGQNTGLLLPQALARLIPIVNNARIPGRALLVVAMCLTVLSAMALQRLRVTGKSMLAAAIVGIALLESVAAPLPLVALPSAGVYAALAVDASRSTVLTVPFGIRDGFGQTGLLEHDGLYGQTVHGHPMTGGFIARMPASIRAWYTSHQPFAALLAMSEGRTSPAPSCEQAALGLRAANVKYVVVYAADASPALREFVASVLPLRERDRDEQRVLYDVEPCRELLR
jgi:hypothetical protein